MCTGLNVFDEAVVEGILKDCDFNKDMTITEVINTIKSNTEKYCSNVTYSSNSMVLHIEGINGFKVNISIKQKKIIIILENNKGEKASISHALYFEDKPIGEVHALLLNNFDDRYSNFDLEELWKLISKDSDIESIDYIFSILIRDNVYNNIDEKAV